MSAIDDLHLRFNGPVPRHLERAALLAEQPFSAFAEQVAARAAFEFALGQYQTAKHMWFASRCPYREVVRYRRATLAAIPRLRLARYVMAYVDAATEGQCQEIRRLQQENARLRESRRRLISNPLSVLAPTETRAAE